MLGHLKQHWTLKQRVLHWIFVPVLVAMVILGMTTNSINLDDVDKFSVLIVHQLLGILVLILAIVRIRWHRDQAKKRRLVTYESIDRSFLSLLSRYTHYGLLVLLIFLPLVGIGLTLVDPFVWPLQARGDEISDQMADITELLHHIHYYGVWLLVTLLVFHIFGAIRHVFLQTE